MTRRGTQCSTPKLHRPDEPTGYLAWHEWAEKVRKTHVQRRCPGCGLFAVWVPRLTAVAARAAETTEET